MERLGTCTHELHPDAARVSAGVWTLVIHGPTMKVWWSVVNKIQYDVHTKAR